MNALPKKIEDLLELGRANGWTVEVDDTPEEIPGISRAVGLGFARTLDDGRILFFVAAYGRRNGARSSWVLLHDDAGYAVHGQVSDPTVPDFLGADLERRWKAVADLRYWLENSDELVELWTTSGALKARRALRDRLIPGAKS